MTRLMMFSKRSWVRAGVPVLTGRIEEHRAGAAVDHPRPVGTGRPADRAEGNPLIERGVKQHARAAHRLAGRPDALGLDAVKRGQDRVSGGRVRKYRAC
jgi:hypothetical protein